MQGPLSIPTLFNAVLYSANMIFSSRAVQCLSIMHLDAPLKNASSGTDQNAGVETDPAWSDHRETETSVCLDLCRSESCHYGYDHKSNVGPCQGQQQFAKWSVLPQCAWGAIVSVCEIADVSVECL